MLVDTGIAGLRFFTPSLDLKLFRGGIFWQDFESEKSGADLLVLTVVLTKHSNFLASLQ